MRDEGGRSTSRSSPKTDHVLTSSCPPVLPSSRPPPNHRKSVEQTPNLKLVQLISAGYTHYEGTDFYKSLDESNSLILANASGIHVVRLRLTPDPSIILAASLLEEGV